MMVAVADIVSSVDTNYKTETASGKIIQSLRDFRKRNHDICQSSDENAAFFVDPNFVTLEPGFNAREMGMGWAYYELPEVRAHIENIKNAFINGEYVDPIKVKVLDGVLIVRQGHCRTIAAKLAQSEGHTVINFLCVETKNDEVGDELQTLDGNKGLALSPVAIGESYRRLTQGLGGWSPELLAQKQGVSVVTVNTYIRLTELSFELKKFIHAGVISHGQMLDMVSEMGQKETARFITERLAELQAQNDGIKLGQKPKKLRITASAYKAPPVPPKLATKAVEGLKCFAPSLLEQLTEIPDEQTEVTVKLDRNAIETLKMLQAEIKDFEDRQIRKMNKRNAKLANNSADDNAGSDDGAGAGADQFQVQDQDAA
ncbi:DNA-binding protein [Leclercia adecarboxylata]|uniref:DNA-binding protein n=1 Tax=Leclercia adecarboxylata TaxID=83655 RepID=UPI001140A0AD|nr:DNA-binding protein [Leclercia adecarboxylata]MCE9984682.1 DNA-binding protein [Leclercia adecarboxylata]